MDSPKPLMLSIPETAVLLGVGATLVRRLIDDGSLRSFKIGGRRLVRRMDVDAFVAGLSATDPA